MAKGKQKNPNSNKAEGPERQDVTTWTSFREEPEGEYLTTDQGLRINDDQNSLKAGERVAPCWKTSSCAKDHPLRPRANSRAGRSRARAGAHGHFQVYKSLVSTRPPSSSRPGRQDPRLRSLLHRRRLPRLIRSGPRRARLRRQFYTERANYDLVGNNILSSSYRTR